MSVASSYIIRELTPSDGKLFLAVELRFQFGFARKAEADEAIPAGMLGEAQDATVAAVLHGLAEKGRKHKAALVARGRISLTAIPSE